MSDATRGCNSGSLGPISLPWQESALQETRHNNYDHHDHNNGPKHVDPPPLGVRLLTSLSLACWSHTINNLRHRTGQPNTARMSGQGSSLRLELSCQLATVEEVRLEQMTLFGELKDCFKCQIIRAGSERFWTDGPMRGT
jgi:hypothetical protein